MKKFLIVLISLIFLLTLTVSAKTYFKKGGKYLTPQLGLNSYAVPFGVSYGMGITDNIEVGGTVMAYFWGDDWYSYSVITPSLDVLYHFTKLDIQSFDLFAGVTLGYSIVSWSSDYYDYGGSYGSSLYLSPNIGARYYFNEKFAVSLRAYFSAVGDLSGGGGLLGLTIIM